MDFKKLLASQVQRILTPSLAIGLVFSVSCSTAPETGRTVEEVSSSPDGATNSDASTPSDATGGLCGEVSSEKYSRERGFIVVAVGEECPDEPKITLVRAYDCCPFLKPLETCNFIEKQENVSPPTVGNSIPPEEDEKVTVCVYYTVFEVGNGCCGRPLLSEGHMVLAPAQADILGWDERAELVVVASEEVREAAGAYWLSAARMEHASIASFSRFAIELLRLGAPSELVVEAHRAALDEVEHARLCFGLASGLLKQKFGPGPLPLGTSLELSANRVEFAEAVALEGCVGESLAALEAAARLRHATDPAVRSALTQIIDDESAHAALAWSTLEWLLRDDADGTIAVRLEEIFSEPPNAKGGLAEIPEGGASLGLLSDAQRDEVFENAWERVITPAWQNLCA